MCAKKRLAEKPIPLSRNESIGDSAEEVHPKEFLLKSGRYNEVHHMSVLQECHYLFHFLSISYGDIYQHYGKEQMFVY